MPPHPPRIEGPGCPSIITAAYFSRVGRLLQNILKPLKCSDDLTWLRCLLHCCYFHVSWEGSQRLSARRGLWLRFARDGQVMVSFRLVVPLKSANSALLHHILYFSVESWLPNRVFRPVTHASMICCNHASEAGSDEIMLPMHACISSSSIVDFTVWLRIWSLESGSAMYIFLPGTCLISLKWNLISRILNLSLLDGSWSRCVSTEEWHQGFMVCFHRDWFSQDRSHGHVSTRASFSICAYLVSVGVLACDMNETGCQELLGWS